MQTRDEQPPTTSAVGRLLFVGFPWHSPLHVQKHIFQGPSVTDRPFPRSRAASQLYFLSCSSEPMTSFMALVGHQTLKDRSRAVTQLEVDQIQIGADCVVPRLEPPGCGLQATMQH